MIVAAELLFSIIVLTIIVMLMARAREPYQEYDGRTLPNGHTYTFSVGDGLSLYGRGKTYFGMSIHLPKQFPHVYLDSRRGGGSRADYIIDPAQRISLEGNFDTYFQLYASKESGSLALSIITPDVMQTLLSMAGDYDIELYKDRLNIISHKSVLLRPQKQREMQQIMEVLLVRLDLKMRTWPATYKLEQKDKLKLYPLTGVRLFGRYVPLRFVVFNIVWGIWVLLWAISVVTGILRDSIQTPIVSSFVTIVSSGFWIIVIKYFYYSGTFKPR